jgi:uncharacterized protein (TIGR00255 family)
LRERVASKVARGMVDLSFRLRVGVGVRPQLQVNNELLEQLALLARRHHAQFPNMSIDFIELLRYPGVVEDTGVDQLGLQADAMSLLDQTLDAFVASRVREGSNLAAAMHERVDGIERIAAQVRGWLPDIRIALRSRLDQRLADLKQPLEPGRLEQEVVLNLQKIDVDEELDRLASHIGEARRVLSLPEAVGRRLDFLMQEFNREANTLGSKSVDARTTQAAVDLKVLIEQLREQVQNLE